MIKLENIAIIGEEIALKWSDDQENYISFEKLRRSCPCAHCQGEPDALGRLIKPDVQYAANAFQLLRYEPIGGYALQLTWRDGHSTGLYAYDLLRSL